MRGKTLTWVVRFMLLAASAATHGVGTEAGTMISNTATVTFEIDGAPQPPVESAAAVTRVDERIDVAVVSLDGGLPLMSSAAGEATASFEVANAGNGSEGFRLVVDAHVDEGGFDPLVLQSYVESNGVPGLQVGAAGDTPYAQGDAPELAANERVVVHVVLRLPDGVGSQAEGIVRLSAVADTIARAYGVDDPEDAGFPAAGAFVAGAGDAGVGAVVGLSHTAGATTISAEATLRVDGPFVQLSKTALAIDDGQGGARVTSGTQITYEIAVEVIGSGSVGDLLLTDPVPDSLEYVPGSLAVDGTPQDDDFLPRDADFAGFNTAGDTVSVRIGDLPAGAAPRRVTFTTRVR